MSEVTRILSAIEQGDPAAAEQLLPLVYDELRRLANAHMAGERSGQTLDATALVHEAYLRLAGGQSFDSRSHFFAAAAQAPAPASQPAPTAEQIKAAAAMPFRNPALPIDKRVDDLVSRLTLEEKVSQMIDSAAAVPRLDIPAYNWWNEGLHGIARSGFATMFPQAIGNAATWDAPLVHSIGAVVSTEARWPDVAKTPLGSW